MGWTGYYREPGESDLDHLQRELFPESGQRILAGHTARSQWGERVFYAAVRMPDKNEVWALIVLQKGNRSSYVRKELEESMGVGEYDCPDRILDLLTPTDDKIANEWRVECRERNAAKRANRSTRPKLSNGTRFKVAKPWEFMDGTTEDTFDVVDSRKRRYRRASDGSLVRLPARSRWPEHEVVR